MMMSKNKSLIILTISLFLLISSSFAWLNITKKSEKINALRAGNLSLVLDESTSEGINLEDAVPISDEKGLAQEGYTFRLVNNGSVKASYIITLDDIDISQEEERMSDDILKYSLEKNGEKKETVFLPSIKENKRRIVDRGVINAKTTNTYTLKLWMDYDTTNEGMNKTFAARLNVEVEQENIKTDKSEISLDINDNTKTLGLEDKIENYEIESSDEEVAEIDSLGNIVGKHYGTVVFKVRNKITGAKKDITVTITKKLKVTFVKQAGVDKISKNEETCLLKEKEEKSCSITLPEITPEQGYTKVGWSTEKGSHVGAISRIDISEDTNVYTIVKKDEIVYTATFNKQVSGVSQIGSTTVSCTIPSVYNEEKQEESCKITTPEIVTEQGYNAIGWNKDKTAITGIKPKTEIELKSDEEYYPIIKKDAITLSAKFYKNGASSLDGFQDEVITKTCILEEKYNGEVQETECSIITPEIKASSATPNVVGYNENKDATSGSVGSKTEITLSSDKEYYAITKSELKTNIATFYKNGAISLDEIQDEFVTRKCNISVTYNGEKQEKSCKVTSPEIKASSNTPIVLGYSESIDNHTAILNSNVEFDLSENTSYYAQTKKDKVIYTATYKVGKNVISVEKENNTCEIPEVYNGDIQETSCSVEGGKITPKVGYTSVGYSKTNGDLTGNTTLELANNTTFYANAVANSYTVEYYSGLIKLGTSGIKVDEDLTLPTIKSLNGEQDGYTFKGWTKINGSETVEYTDGENVSNLSTIEGEVVKLYAIYVDDIKPVCSFSSTKEIYVNETDTIELTCKDLGSKLKNTNLEINNFEISNASGSVIAVSNPTEVENGYKYTVSIKGLKAGETQNTNGSFSISLKENSISDNSNNGNIKTISSEEIVKGYTYSINYEKSEGVESITSTKTSCTTILGNLTCDVTLPGINELSGYTKDGWYKDNEKVGIENAVYTLNSSNTGNTLIAKAIRNAHIVEYDFNNLNDMTKWKYFYSERFNNIYDSTTNLTDIKVTGGDGWEIIYLPITTEIGKKYTLTFDYQVPNGYNPLSGYQGVGYQILNNSPSNDDNSSNQVAIGYIPTDVMTTTKKATLEFTATTSTSYLAFNFGMAKDNETIEIKIGNISLNEEYEYNKQISLNKIADLDGYKFVGWNTDKNSNVKLETLKMENSDIKLYAIYVKEVYEFDYTGSEQVFTVPVSGIYKLETWGAQGGNATDVYIGGYGGYSDGTLRLKNNQEIYINVGGLGKSNGYKSELNGGYNGGGKVLATDNTNHQYGSGGGATHVATKSGLLSTLENSKESILMVSGAGGGGRYQQNYDASCGNGGSGGGIKGVTGEQKGSNITYATGGTQTEGGQIVYKSGTTIEDATNIYKLKYAKGLFGTAGTTTACSSGGGGYYGGAGTISAGGGGSGYIGNSLLTDKAMYCYNCQESSEESTKTISTTCTSPTPTEKCAKKGNGYAKITLISID